MACFPRYFEAQGALLSNQEKETAMTAHAIGFGFYLATNAISIALALLVATPATPAEFKRYPQPNGRPNHIVVSGGIRTNDERKFVELTADLKDATIILDSPG